MATAMLSLALVALSLPQQPSPTTFAVRGKVVHTMVGAPIDDGVVLVEGGKITRVGKAGEVVLPAGVLVRTGEVMEQMASFYKRFFRYGTEEHGGSVPRILDQDWVPRIRPRRWFRREPMRQTEASVRQQVAARLRSLRNNDGSPSTVNHH